MTLQPRSRAHVALAAQSKPHIIQGGCGAVDKSLSFKLPPVHSRGAARLRRSATVRTLFEQYKGVGSCVVLFVVIAITVVVYAAPLAQLWQASTLPQAATPPPAVEIADDAGRPDWRAPLARTTDVITKTLVLPAGFEATDYRRLALKIMMASANNPASDDNHLFDLVVRVDNHVLSRYRDGPPVGAEWRTINVDPALVAGKRDLVVTLALTGIPDPSVNYVNVFGASGQSAGRSQFNGRTNDLSREPGIQEGEYLIRLSLEPQPFGRAGSRLPYILGLPIIALVLYNLPGGRRRRAVVAIAGFGALLALAAVLDIGVLVPVFLLFVLAADWIPAVFEAPGDRAARRRAVLSSFLVLLWIAFALRWWELASVMGTTLCPDAITYRALADGSRALFDTDFREPLFIWIVKTAFFVLGSSDLALRYASLALSMILIVATFWFSRKLAGDFVALLASAIVAFNSDWVSSSVQGIRIELMAITVLWFLGTVFLARERRRGADPRPVDGAAANNAAPGVRQRLRRQLGPDIGSLVWMGIAGAAVCLTQVSSLVFVAPLLLYGLWRGRRPLWQAVLPLGLIVLFLAPHLAENYVRHGDPMYSSNIHAVWYRNYEFLDQPGYVTRAQFDVNAYSGPYVTTAQYIFGMHSLPQVATRYIAGISDTLLGPRLVGHMLAIRSLPPLRGDISAISNVADMAAVLVVYALAAAYIVGFLLLVRSSKRFVPVALFALTLPTAFLVQLELDPRLVMHLQPLVAVCIAVAVSASFKWVWARPKRFHGNVRG